MRTCQHCQAELANPRARNCRTCAGILNDANRRGAYGLVMEAIATAKASGLTGDDMHQTMQAALEFGAGRRNEWAAEYRKSQKQKAAERSRAIQFYRQNGYWKGSIDRDEDARKDIEDGRNFNPRPTTEPEIYG